jgi:hypothetical protein
MNNIELRQLDIKDKYEDGNLAATISTKHLNDCPNNYLNNYLNMFINLLIQIIKLITSTGEEVCRNISVAIIRFDLVARGICSIRGLMRQRVL